MDKVLVIKGDTITTLYSDDLRELGGTLHVERASNVEFDEQSQGWLVQLANGMFLCETVEGCGWRESKSFRTVFPTRDEALTAEVTYLQARL